MDSNSFYKKKYDELCEEITKLQEKYDENGYDYSPIIKLQRIEQYFKLISCKMKEHDLIKLTEDLVNISDNTEMLTKGDIGTIIHIYPNSEAYVIKFEKNNIITTLKPHQIINFKG